MKFPRKYCLYFILAIIFVYSFVVFCFNIEGFIPIGSNLGKENWLTFLGAFLGFIGTTGLGLISLWLNLQFQKVNQNLALQNAISQFYSELIPTSVDIQIDKLNSPLGCVDLSISQVLLNEFNSIGSYFELYFIRLYFKNIHAFPPSFYRINDIHLGIRNQNNENVEKLSWYCSKPDKTKLFKIGKKPNEGVIVPIFLDYSEQDNFKWLEVLQSPKVNFFIEFIYKNPQRITAETRIEINYKKAKKQSDTGLIRYELIDYVIIENTFSSDFFS